MDNDGGEEIASVKRYIQCVESSALRVEDSLIRLSMDNDKEESRLRLLLHQARCLGRNLRKFGSKGVNRRSQLR